RRYSRALHQRQQVALHALARHVRAVDLGTARDLVDLVQEHDAVLLRIGHCTGLELVVVHQAPRLFLDDELHRLADLHAPQALAAAAEVGEHSLNLRGELLHAGRREDLHLRLRRGHLDVDLLVVELAFAQFFPELLARDAFFLGPFEAHQHVEDAVLGRVLGARAHALDRLIPRLLDADLDQVAHDGVDVAADVADLGELGRLDLDERRVGEPREAPRDLGLAHAGGPDHEDVLGRDFLAQRIGDLLPPPAVAQGDRHRALGSALPDDVLVELMHDLLGSHTAHSRTSMVL